MSTQKRAATTRIAQGRRALLQQEDIRKKKDRQAILMLCGVIVALILGALGYFVSLPPAIDKENLCRLDGEIPSHDIILIDGTDKLPPQILKRVKSQVRKLKTSMNDDAKLTLLILNGDDELETVSEIFSICNPTTSVNALIRNQKWAREQWVEKFARPLDKHLDNLLNLPEASQTPLLQALQDISFREDFSHSQNNRNLWVISDFLQHSEEFSQYSDRRSYEEVFEDSLMQSYLADFIDVQVQATYVNRKKTKHVQTKAHKDFWQYYFEVTSGSEARFSP